jgi:hypothetical protein
MRIHIKLKVIKIIVRNAHEKGQPLGLSEFFPSVG